MITLYSTFRSFDHDIYNKIQRDAIESWLQLKPCPEIVIVGNDLGTKEICKEYGLKHVPKVKKSKAGTPYCNDFIQQAEAATSNFIMLLCSGDIMIRQNTIDAATRMGLQSAMQHWCVCPRKKHVEKGATIKEVRWATWQAGDYWLHTKGIFEGMPDFLIGRHRNEKWMYRHLINKNALIDGTEAITVLHQMHPHDFKPSNKEIEHNKKLYDENYFEVEKWKDTIWYEKNSLFNVGINHANYIMGSDFSLRENNSPRRSDWNER